MRPTVCIMVKGVPEPAESYVLFFTLDLTGVILLNLNARNCRVESVLRIWKKSAVRERRTNY